MHLAEQGGGGTNPEANAFDLSTPKPCNGQAAQRCCILDQSYLSTIRLLGLIP